MRILHFSDRLPDIRVERMAVMDHLIGHNPSIIVANSNSYGLEGIVSFENEKLVNITPRNKLGFSKKILEKKLIEYIDEIDPDIIHAHDIYNAQIMSKLFPDRMIVNAHEFWNIQYNYRIQVKYSYLFKNPYQYFINRLAKYQLSRWEKILSQNFPLISISEPILKHFKEFGGEDIIYIPNMPLIEEVNAINMADSRFDKKTLAFLGSDLSHKTQVEYRSTRGFWDNFNKSDVNLMLIGDKQVKSNNKISSVGYVPHLDCGHYLSKAHFGTLGFVPHKFHSDISPNKIYLYAHVGLWTFLPNYLHENISGSAEFSSSYSSMGDLFDKINTIKIKDIDHFAITKFARSELIMNNYTSELKELYSSV